MKTLRPIQQFYLLIVLQEMTNDGPLASKRLSLPLHEYTWMDGWMGKVTHGEMGAV